MNPVAKLLVTLGIALIIGGVLWQLFSKFGIPLGKLPGDIAIRRPGMKIYFPIVTCLLISVALSLLAPLIQWLIRWFSQHR
jgi:hypothetical protein